MTESRQIIPQLFIGSIVGLYALGIYINIKNAYSRNKMKSIIDKHQASIKGLTLAVEEAAQKWGNKGFTFEILKIDERTYTTKIYYTEKSYDKETKKTTRNTYLYDTIIINYD